MMHTVIECVIVNHPKGEPVEILFLIRIVIYIHIKTIFITFFFVDISHVHVYGTFFLNILGFFYTYCMYMVRYWTILYCTF